MNKLPQTFPAGDLRAHANKAFELAQSGPVMVLSKATPKAIMVSPEIWDATALELNKLILRIEELEDSVEVWRGLYELETGKDKIVPADIAELERIAGRVPA